MKRRVNFTKLLALVTVISVIISICLVAANASSGTVYESGNNNTHNYATETHDDRDNYGSISPSSSDVDWWIVQFEEEGMANFWLGEIPAQTDYKLEVYLNATDRLIYSDNSGRKQELVRCHVQPRTPYYIKISSSEGSSSTNYKMRVKNYPFESNNFNGKLFYSDYTNYTTELGITRATNHIWNMGFSAGYYRNNTVGPAYSVLPNTTIFVVSGKGAPGQVYFHDPLNASNRTILYAKSNSDMTSNDRSLSNFTATGLSGVDLAIFLSPYSGITDPDLGNIVDETLGKDARFCIGWLGALNSREQNDWISTFFSNCYNNVSVADAIEITNNTIASSGYVSSTSPVFDLYYGNGNTITELHKLSLK